MRVDYHIHTICSDGIYTVPEVIQKLRQEDVEVFSITDHDTIAGIKQAAGLCQDMEFVPGLEITCAEKKIPGIMTSFSIHLLGYGIDETNQELMQILDRRECRRKKIFENLAVDFSQIGWKISIEEIPISCGTVLQLCDITDYLESRYGSLSQAVRGKLEQYRQELLQANISVEEGIRVIHGAGGTAVWAHPLVFYHFFEKKYFSYEQVETVLPFLIADGLDGMETDYLSFDRKSRMWLEHIAMKNKLICTAGTDFHGLPGRESLGIESEHRVRTATYGDRIAGT